MRRLLLAVSVMALAACTPDIAEGSYFCGPQLACPGDLACSDLTELCVDPARTQTFVCPNGANAHEPDDDLAHAQMLTGVCFVDALVDTGCLPTQSDVDYALLSTPSSCGARIRVTVNLTDSIAFESPQITLLDNDNPTTAMSAPCTPNDALMSNATDCSAIDVDGGDHVSIRVDFPADAPSCQGACAFNRYELRILLNTPS